MKICLWRGMLATPCPVKKHYFTKSLVWNIVMWVKETFQLLENPQNWLWIIQTNWPRSFAKLNKVSINQSHLFFKYLLSIDVIWYEGVLIRFLQYFLVQPLKTNHEHILGTRGYTAAQKAFRPMHLISPFISQRWSASATVLFFSYFCRWCVFTCVADNLL